MKFRRKKRRALADQEKLLSMANIQPRECEEAIHSTRVTGRSSNCDDADPNSPSVRHRYRQNVNTDAGDEKNAVIAPRSLIAHPAWCAALRVLSTSHGCLTVAVVQGRCLHRTYAAAP